MSFLILCSPVLAGEKEKPTEEKVDSSKYLNAVRQFADNVLKHGRDTYGPKHTPLFVDGLNIHTHEPVKWIAPNGDRWVLSNLASQQNLFRVLDGLTKITGDPKYKQAAMDAIRYAFDNLRSPNGLLYWGVSYAYDADGDTVCSTVHDHSLRYNFPYYELMWEVSQDGLRDYVESFWAAHILDWSSLDMLRYATLDSYKVAKGWEHEYKGGPVFFTAKGDCSFIAASPLSYAAAMLSRLSGEREPFIWSKRLVHRYVETRNPNTGIASFVYGKSNNIISYQFSDILESYNISFPSLFPPQPKVLCDPETVRPTFAFQIRGWICVFLLGELLGSEGQDFKRWALEELTAWGKSAYRKEDNTFIPMFTDGTRLEGYALKKDGYYGARGTVYKAWHPGVVDLWGYALAYRLTDNEFMWEMTRDITQGNNFGDIGLIVNGEPELQKDTDCSDPYVLLGFLELYNKTKKVEFLKMASKIGDNILAQRLVKGFFVSSKSHIYTRFDALEHLSLLHLFAAIESKSELVPWVWPNEACFGWDYRQQSNVFDVEIIYNLTDSPEPPLTLHEAAAIGDLEQVKLLLSKGAEINLRERPMWTPLHRAVTNGQKDIIAFLLAKGADVDARNSWPGGTALHYAVEKGHKEIAVLLIENGADVNAQQMNGDTPLQFAARYNRKDTIKLLLEKGATISNIYLAAYMGDLAKLDTFIQEGVGINTLDGHGYAPLHYAAQNEQKEAVELLIARGADVNVKIWNGKTLLHIAASQGHKDVIELLITHGADINAKDNQGMTVVLWAAQKNHQDIAKFLITKGADINERSAKGHTPLHFVVSYGHKDVVELLIAKGADVNAKNNDGQRPLDLAMILNRKGIFELLLEEGAELSMHTAAYLGDIDKVRNFIEAGTNVNGEPLRGGITPLYWAVREHHEDVAELLIEKGANVQVKNRRGWTPLHHAVRGGNRDMVELLITKCADVNAKLKSGKTALSLAKERGHTEIVELLRKHGAKE
jgi:pectate lyase